MGLNVMLAFFWAQSLDPNTLDATKPQLVVGYLLQAALCLGTETDLLVSAESVGLVC